MHSCKDIFIAIFVVLAIAEATSASAEMKDPRWQEAEEAIRSQRYAQAETVLAGLLQDCRNSSDEHGWATALIKISAVKITLHGYEHAVRFLLAEPWPDTPLPHALLDLFTAGALRTYYESYSWEINRREEMTGDTGDLRTWTARQLFEAADMHFAGAWKLRRELADRQDSELPEIIRKGSYPAAIRASLRDFISYSWATFLVDSSTWRPGLASELYKLDFNGMAAGSAFTDPEDMTAHPLLRAMGVLHDLEAWHTELDDGNNTLEVQLERIRGLFPHFSKKSQQKTLVRDLYALCEDNAALPWSAVAGYELASRIMDHDPGEAHRVCLENHKRHPGSIGGRFCKELATIIEAPDYDIQVKELDGPGKPSLQVRSKNMSRFFLRAYRLDLESIMSVSDDYRRFQPSWDELRSLVEKHPPQAAWHVDLNDPGDFLTHGIMVTPPLPEYGYYLIAASVNNDFTTETNKIQVVFMQVSPILLLRIQRDDGFEFQVLRGETGEPVSGAVVTLHPSRKKDDRKQSATTGNDGRAMFSPGDAAASFVATASWEGHTVFEPATFRSRTVDNRTHTRHLIYTDRPVYRPEQTLHYKVLSYNGRNDVFKSVAGEHVTVTLYDPNGREVDKAERVTNEFGTISGSFTIPAGRLLGGYWLRTSHGAAGLRVEEYKRPTFEVALQAPEEEARLNAPVMMKAEGRYYFGMPVSEGEVTWRVNRRLVYPYWFWWRYADRVGAGDRQMIAAGSAALDSTGTCLIRFRPEADPEAEEPAAVSYAFEVSVEITDAGGETRTAQRTIYLGYCAVNADISMANSWLAPGRNNEVTVQRRDLNGTARPGNGTWELVPLIQPDEVRRPHQLPWLSREEADPPRWTRDPGLEQRLFNWPEGEPITGGGLKHDAGGSALIQLDPLRAGAYRLRYETRDEAGMPYTTSRDFVVAGPGTTVAVPLFAFTGRDVVKVGERADFLVGSGFGNHAFTLEICRDDRLLKRLDLRSDDGAVSYSMPVGEDLRGGFSVRVYTADDYYIWSETRRIAVPWDNKNLSLELDSFRDTLAPGDRETWSITVKGPGSELVSAEILAYMYDRSLDIFGTHSYPVVKSIYPAHTGTPGLTYSLNADHGRTLFFQRWYELPVPGVFLPDRLLEFDRFGVGGPGGRWHRGNVGEGSPAKGLDREYTERLPVTAMRTTAAPAGEVGGEMHDAVIQGGVQADNTHSLNGIDTAEPPPAPPAEDVPLRGDFAETAFFEPHLTTDLKGRVTITFTVPDSLTSWRFMAHAVTRDLASAVMERAVETRKQLMVRPYLPRFLREGDEAELRVVVNNAGETDLSGQLLLDIIDPETGENRSKDFSLDATAGKWDAKPGESDTLRFTLKAPSHLGAYAVRTVARSGDMSDGELRPLPILPGRMHLSQSRFVTLLDDDERTMRIDDLAAAGQDETLRHESLVVSVDGQLLFTVLRAVPYLVYYPYECVEQTLNRFLYTGILSSLYADYPAVKKAATAFSERDRPLEAWDQEDPNRRMALAETPWLAASMGGDKRLSINVLRPEIAAAHRNAALLKLEKAQMDNGAFPWWSGGPASPYMTIYMLYGLAKAEEFSVPVPRAMAAKACTYLGEYYRDHYEPEKEQLPGGLHFITFLNYVLSCFPDESYYGGGFSMADRRRMLDFSFTWWRDLSPYAKAHLALTLQRMDRPEEARLVLGAIMDSAKTAPDQGVFWAPEERGWLWYNDRIESHAMILRALMEIQPEDEKIDGLVLWLFLNKKMHQWKSTRATAEVLYSLIHYLKAEDALAVRRTATVTLGDRLETMVFAPDDYDEIKQRLVVPGDEVEPAGMSEAVVTCTGQGHMFASMNWHYSTEKLPEEARGDFLQVTREYFLRTLEGDRMLLKPLKDGYALQVGDEVEVHLSITAKHPMEYIHLQDPRGAGFEPVNPTSRYRWDLGISWYEELRDSATNFFFEWLPQGEFPFRYRLRATTAGIFKTAPATIQSMYAPEFSAFSSGTSIRIE
ncbi:hypothetical protein JW905_08490 [bacterium]|nr:hypothetical protein [candidate division CSSED10-310 bacterium]